MTEQTQAVVEQDPFQGQEPTFEEFSKFRESGEVPERFKPAPEVKPEEKPSEAPPEEAKTAEAKEASPEQDKQDRNEQGQFKAKDKEPLFSQDQQRAFDRAFAKREAKLRREFEEQLAAIKTSSNTQDKAPAKEPTKEAAEPAPPELPDITTFSGTAEEFQKALKEYPAKLAAYLNATRQMEEAGKALKSKLAKSEAEVSKEHPEYQKSYADLLTDVENGDEPGLPDFILRAITEDADNPHALTYHLANNREEYRRIAQLEPAQATREILKLEFRLQREKETAAAKPAPEPKPRQTSAPPPPEPVGARVTAKAFDVNDESMSADEWAKKRNEQVHKRR